MKYIARQGEADSMTCSGNPEFLFESSRNGTWLIIMNYLIEKDFQWMKRGKPVGSLQYAVGKGGNRKAKINSKALGKKNAYHERNGTITPGQGT